MLNNKLIMLLSLNNVRQKGINLHRCHFIKEGGGGGAVVWHMQNNIKHKTLFSGNDIPDANGAGGYLVYCVDPQQKEVAVGGSVGLHVSIVHMPAIWEQKKMGLLPTE